jgi:MFS family permease
MLRSLPADFWRLWSVGLIVTTMRWMETVVMGVVVYKETGSALAVASITMLRLLPMGLFGAFLGAIAERVDRRLTLAAVIVLLTLTSAALSLAARLGDLQVWQMALASLINGFGWVTDNPVRRVLMGESVGRERMPTAMAYDVGALNSSRMVGPTVGGLLLVGIGFDGVFLLNAVMYGVAIVLTLAVRTRIAPAPGSGAVLTRALEGFAIVFADRRLAATMVVTIIYNVFGWPVVSMIPVIGRDQLGLGPEGIGILTSIDGVGAFFGAMALALWLTPRWHATAYVGAVAVYQVGVIAFALAPDAVSAGVVMLATGLANAAFATLQATIVYLAAPTEMRSRVLGVLSVCIGTGPIGFVGLGWLADRIGAPTATMVTGLIGLLALAATRPMWRRI